MNIRVDESSNSVLLMNLSDVMSDSLYRSGPEIFFMYLLENSYDTVKGSDTGIVYLHVVKD